MLTAFNAAGVKMLIDPPLCSRVKDERKYWKDVKFCSDIHDLQRVNPNNNPGFCDLWFYKWLT